MSTLWNVIKNIFKMLPWFKPSKTIKKKGKEETDREKDASGMDGVRSGTTKWFERHSRR